MTIWVLMLLLLDCAEDTTVELPFSAMSIPQQVINLSLTAFDTTLLQSNNACAVPHVTSIPLPWHWSIAVSTSLIIMVFIEQTNSVRTYTHRERDGVAREVQCVPRPGSS